MNHNFIVNKPRLNSSRAIAMTLFTEAQKQEILSIAQQHSKIEAIKWIRDHSDLGLKQAKDYIESLLENSIEHSDYSTFQSSTDSSTSSSSIPLQEIHLMLQQGRKIEAIKLVKDSSNIGLKEAKDFVDSLEEHPRSDHTHHPIPRNVATSAASPAHGIEDQSTKRKFPILTLFIIALVIVFIIYQTIKA